jgi:hypothetical protein
MSVWPYVEQEDDGAGGGREMSEDINQGGGNNDNNPSPRPAESLQQALITDMIEKDGYTINECDDIIRGALTAFDMMTGVIETAKSYIGGFNGSDKDKAFWTPDRIQIARDASYGTLISIQKQLNYRIRHFELALSEVRARRKKVEVDEK